MTVGSGLASGLRRPAAVAFAFLLGAAAIGGGTLGKAKDMVAMGAQSGWGPLAAGFVASLVVSLASLWLLTLVVRRKCLKWFALYCYAVGAGVLLAKLTGLW
jgi:undecaprenyl-diphosphatase